VRRGLIVLALGALTGLVLVLLDGYHSWAGPEVLELSPTHGLHLFDFPILAAWLVAVVCAWKLWGRR
jgi:hypothetical protein